MITLNDIKNEWETTHYLQDSMVSLDQYIRENYTPIYDKNLNFMGYEKGVINHECI